MLKMKVTVTEFNLILEALFHAVDTTRDTDGTANIFLNDSEYATAEERLAIANIVNRIANTMLCGYAEGGVELEIEDALW